MVTAAAEAAVLYFQSVYFNRRTPWVHRRLYGPHYIKTKTLECSPMRFASFFLPPVSVFSSRGKKRKKEKKKRFSKCHGRIVLRWWVSDGCTPEHYRGSLNHKSHRLIYSITSDCLHKDNVTYRRSFDQWNKHTNHIFGLLRVYFYTCFFFFLQFVRPINIFFFARFCSE